MNTNTISIWYMNYPVNTSSFVHREGQPVWEFPMPPVKTGESPRLVKIVARRRVGSKKRRTFLYRCEWDDNT